LIGPTQTFNPNRTAAQIAARQPICDDLFSSISPKKQVQNIRRLGLGVPVER
jgi:hypothetical protein